MGAQNIEAIVAGGSAGALEALAVILPALPADYAIPIALVLHLPPTKPNHLVDVLRAKCRLTVKEAEDKEPILPGTLYVAPANYHLLIEESRSFSLSADAPVHYSRPSIDVLFESAADAYGPALGGVLLAGANEDGARGLARIHSAGGTTIVESPDSAAVPTMPAAALKIARADEVLPAREIGHFLARAGGRTTLPLEAR